MKIKNLPLYIKQTAFLRQIEQGNKEEENVDLITSKHGGNFNWSKTKEKEMIWDDINSKSYINFCKFHKIKEEDLNKPNLKYKGKYQTSSEKTFMDYNFY